MAAVSMRGVRKTFGSTVALESLDLEIETGELVCLLGPSGCGKTTALRILAGFERPDAGQVEVGGTDITRTPTEKRGFGMVFQEYSLFPNMTARANIEFGLRVRKIATSERTSTVDGLLEVTGLRSTRASIRTSSPAARSSASPWPGRSPRSRGCCCWTSRCRPSMRRCASRCATRSAACSGSSA